MASLFKVSPFFVQVIYYILIVDMADKIKVHKRVLITGGSGMLGANLAFYLSQTRPRWQLHITYLAHRVEMPGVGSHCCDLLDAAGVRRLMEEVKPELIIHCAAATDLDYCEQHPGEALLVNAGTTMTMMGWASHLEGRLIYISTDAVFGVARKRPFTEKSEIQPLSEYAYTKFEGELDASCIGDKALIVRTCIFGCNPTPRQSLAEWMVAEMSAGNPITGFTDVRFNPILTTDFAEALLLAIEHELAGLYHISGANALSKYDFAVLLANTFGYNPEMVVPGSIADLKLPAPRPPAPILGCGKFMRATGFKLPTIKAGVERFYQQYINGYRNRLKSFYSDEEHL
jgi:dTDP-4-dehydrorhamnose reductase